MFMVLENGCKTIVVTSIEGFNIYSYIDFIEGLWESDESDFWDSNGNEIDFWGTMEMIAGYLDMGETVKTSSNPHEFSYGDDFFLVGDSVQANIKHIVDFITETIGTHDEFTCWGLLRMIAMSDVTEYTNNIHIKRIQKGVDKNKSI